MLVGIRLLALLLGNHALPDLLLGEGTAALNTCYAQRFGRGNTPYVIGHDDESALPEQCRLNKNRVTALPLGPSFYVTHHCGVYAGIEAFQQIGVGKHLFADPLAVVTSPGIIGLWTDTMLFPLPMPPVMITRLMATAAFR